MLIRCAHEAHEGIVDLNTILDSDTFLMLNSNQQQSVSDSERIINQMIIESESIDEGIKEGEGEEDEEDEEKLIQAIVLTKKKRRERQRTITFKYEKLLSLSNVHAELHLTDMAREYATLMNCNVLADELKHKYFLSLPS